MHTLLEKIYCRALKVIFKYLFIEINIIIYHAFGLSRQLVIIIVEYVHCYNKLTKICQFGPFIFYIHNIDSVNLITAPLTGGLMTVILTDALAVFIMVIGGMLLCIIGNTYS